MGEGSWESGLDNPVEAEENKKGKKKVSPEELSARFRMASEVLTEGDRSGHREAAEKNATAIIEGEDAIDRLLKRRAEGNLPFITPEKQRQAEAYDAHMSRLRKNMGIKEEGEENMRVTETDIEKMFTERGLKAAVNRRNKGTIVILSVYEREGREIENVFSAQGKNLKELYKASLKFLETYKE